MRNRALFLLIAVVLSLGMASLARAAAVDDVKCVQAYLKGAGAPDGRLGKKTAAVASQFRDQFELTDALPLLSAETASAWCAFTQSETGVELALLATYTIYPIELQPTNEELASPYFFDFAKAKLTSKYDGYRCGFDLFRIEAGKEERIGGGRLSFADSRVRFDDASWNRGGLATPETFDEANLAVTEKGLIVGKMPMFPMYINVGDIPQEAIVTTVKITKGKLGDDKPEGTVFYDVEPWTGAKLFISFCSKAD